MFDILQYKSIANVAKENNATIVAVTKTKPVEDILMAYNNDIRDFGENKVQELCAKYECMPKDIRWHMIGHLQSNKIKYIAHFVHLIHGIDSYSLLEAVNKEAAKCNRTIRVLLQVHIAREEKKFGFHSAELLSLLDSQKYRDLQHIEICGLMGMATNTSDIEMVKEEFASLHQLYIYIQKKYFDSNKSFCILSMGMSGDYTIALSSGSNMLRIGSILFGHR